MATQTTDDLPRVADCGHSIITVDYTEEGRVWWEDGGCYLPTVVVRMTPLYAERRAEVLADWSRIADMMDGSGDRCERRFAALLMHAALMAEGKTEEADAEYKRIIDYLVEMPEQRDPLVRWPEGIGLNDSFREPGAVKTSTEP